jgi:ABC-type siderophore export system fused ATPase/permease subunit
MSDFFSLPVLIVTIVFILVQITAEVIRYIVTQQKMVEAQRNLETSLQNSEKNLKSIMQEMDRNRQQLAEGYASLVETINNTSKSDTPPKS